MAACAKPNLLPSSEARGDSGGFSAGDGSLVAAFCSSTLAGVASLSRLDARWAIPGATGCDCSKRATDSLPVWRQLHRTAGQVLQPPAAASSADGDRKSHRRQRRGPEAGRGDWEDDKDFGSPAEQRDPEQRRRSGHARGPDRRIARHVHPWRTWRWECADLHLRTPSAYWRRSRGVVWRNPRRSCSLHLRRSGPIRQPYESRGIWRRDPSGSNEQFFPWRNERLRHQPTRHLGVWRSRYLSHYRVRELCGNS